MDNASVPITHRARVNAFQGEAVWALGPDALERTGGEPTKAPMLARISRLYLRILLPFVIESIDAGGPARYPYGAIKELRLCFDPTRFDDIDIKKVDPCLIKSVAAPSFEKTTQVQST